MAFEDDIADDWEVFDATSLVTITPRNQANVTPVPNIVALRGNISTYLMANGIGTLKFQADDVVFSLWRSTMAGLVPREEFVITEADDTKWRVLYVRDLRTLDTRYLAFCRKWIGA